LCEGGWGIDLSLLSRKILVRAFAYICAFAFFVVDDDGENCDSWHGFFIQFFFPLSFPLLFEIVGGNLAVLNAETS
jgi:hypothetical protein